MKFAAVSLSILYAASLLIAPVAAQEGVFLIRGGYKNNNSNNEAVDVTGPAVNRRLRVPTGQVYAADGTRPLHRRAKSTSKSSSGKGSPSSSEEESTPTGVPTSAPTTSAPTVTAVPTPNRCGNSFQTVLGGQETVSTVVAKGNYIVAGDAGNTDPNLPITDPDVRIFLKSATGDYELTATIPPPPGDDGGFGADVDITNVDGRQTLVIGSPGTEPLGGDGRVHVYRETMTGSGMFELDKTYIEPSPFPGPIAFGTSVAINDDNTLLVVGAPGTTTIEGSATVFERTPSGSGDWPDDGTVVRTVKTDPIDSSNDERFGESVAISGNNYAISARQSRDAGFRAGAVFTYTGPSDPGTAVPEPTGLMNGDRFGTDIAMDGQFLVIGSPRHDMPANNAGAAYVYQRDASGAYSEIQKITPGDGEVNDRFGSAVGIGGQGGGDESGRRIVVGSPLDDNLQGNNSGAVYVYSGAPGTAPADAAFNLRNKVTSCVTGNGADFGRHVDVSEDGFLAAAGDEVLILEDVSGTEI